MLSACLGLLVGGVPAQIQAQQATVTAAGELQPALGVPQCLGAATPEAEKLLNRGVFSRPFVSFVAKVSKLIAKDNLDWNNLSYLSFSLEHTSSGYGSVTITDNTRNQMFIAAAQGFAEEVFTDLALDDNKVAFYEEDATHLSVTFQMTHSELVTDVAFKQQSPEQARKLATDYNFMLLVGMCRERGQPAELFYQNTQALADNDQVIIITRLPRAALNVPLVEKPAAN
jgi:hypothetical protein